MRFREEINAAVSKRKVHNDAAIQVVTEISNEYAMTDQGVKYVDAFAQTDSTDLETSSRKKSHSETRAPFISTKSKTFPMKTEKCVGNCDQAPPRLASARTSRKQYQDEAIQTDFTELPLERTSPTSNESQRPSFKSSAKTPDRSGTYPFTSPSPFRRSLAKRSPNKSFDEVEARRSPTRNESTNPPTQPRSAIRNNSSLPRCAQCGAEIDLCDLEKLMEAEHDQQVPSLPASQLKSQHASPGAPRSHTCTARSSLECSQCAPRDTSAPYQETSSVVVLQSQQSPKTKESSQPATFLTPDWAATLESSLENIIQSYHTPEERFMQHKVIADTVAEYAKAAPVADPVKKSLAPKLKLRTPPANRPPSKENHIAPTGPPSVLENVLAQSETATTCSSAAHDSAGVSDRSVFRGLHVATAAACDEDVAKWIEEITGTGIRKFLADLSAFDGLGFNTLAGVAKRAAKQRRGEIRAWEKLRETRLQENEADEGWEDCIPEVKQTSCEECAECAAKDDQQGRAKDKKLGFIAGDETVNMRAQKPLREKSAEEIVDSLVKVREGRSRETLKERAVRLGWRDGSVSGEV